LRIVLETTTARVL